MYLLYYILIKYICKYIDYYCQFCQKVKLQKKTAQVQEKGLNT